MPDLPPKYDPTGVSTHQSAEETNDPLIADACNFYKVEKWTKDGAKVERMLYTGEQPRQGAGGLYSGDQASAAHQADHPPADARAGRVAAEMKSPGQRGPGPSSTCPTK
jgi:hypothetical protein